MPRSRKRRERGGLFPKRKLTVKGLKFFTFLLNAFWRALWVLNLFLMAFAAIMAFALFLLCNYGGIPLPDFVDERLKSALEEEGYAVEYDTMRLGLSGNLDINSVAVRFVGTPENFFKASRLRVSFWTMPLLRGEFRIKRIGITNGRLGPTYTRLDSNPILRDISASMYNIGSWWNLENLTFRIGKTLISANGTINDNFNFNEFASALAPRGIRLSGESSKSGTVGKSGVGSVASYANKLDSILAFAPEFTKYSEIFSDPVLDLSFMFSPDGDNRIRAELKSGALVFSAYDREVRAKDMSIKFICKSVGMGNEKITAFFSATELSSDGIAKLENINATAEVIADPGNYALEALDLWAKKIEFEGAVIDNVSIRKDYIDAYVWGEDWKLFVAMDFQRFDAKINLLEDFRSFIVKADFAGNIDPSVVFRRSEFSNIKELDKFSFPDGLGLSGTLSYNTGSKTICMSSNIEASNLTIMDIPVEFCSAHADFDGNIFRASNIIVETREGWQVNGSFTQNVKNNEYFIRIKGNLRPMAISSFMAPWWGKLMSSFSFEGAKNFPYGDVCVEGTWGKPEFIWCYANVKGENAAYRGVNFSGFHVDVWVTPQRISLYDLAIRAKNRNAHGIIEWLYGEDGITTFKKQRIFLESDLNCDELSALGGDDAREVFDIVKFSEAPRITLNAELFNSRTDPDMRDVFNVSAFGPGSTNIEGIVLENLSFNAKSDKINTQIEDAAFGFCNGNGGGNVSLRKRSGGGMDFKANLNADNMNQADFISFLVSLGDKSGTGKKEGNSNGSPDSSDSRIASDRENGLVSVGISLSGDLGDIGRAVGGGYVKVENKELSKLHLFGMLSRALSALRLPLGSFDITYANSPFCMADGEVEFTRLELGGPVMQIKGAASYNFLEDDIRATLVLTPFGGLSVPIVSDVISLINPITNTVQIKVDGSIENPSFGVRLNPINALKSDEKIIEKIRDSL